MSETIISIKNLKKSFGKIEVLNDITIDIQSGEIYGLIGRSGAGKSTLLKILYTTKKSQVSVNLRIGIMCIPYH